MIDMFGSLRILLKRGAKKKWTTKGKYQKVCVQKKADCGEAVDFKVNQTYLAFSL